MRGYSRRLAVLGCLLFGIGGCPVAIVCPTITGKDVIDMARGLEAPIGFGARALYAEYMNNTFEMNVQMSNAWIESQVEAFEQGDSCYMMYLDEMMNGSTVEGGLGMRQWLSDEENLQFWDNFIAETLGEDGYARLIALNSSFGPGSDLFQWTYGGIRRYDAGRNLLLLDSAELPMDETIISGFDPGASTEAKFKLLVELGHEVRMGLYAFYDAFAAGQVSAEEVADFNEAYVVSGGCALASTDTTKSIARSDRYLAALNQVGVKLIEMGYEVRSPLVINGEIEQIDEIPMIAEPGGLN